jgi:predicted alpha-1,2-mannosidase
MTRSLPGAVALFFALPCAAFGRPGTAPPADPASFVNPLIGSKNGGNTFPGAVVPFGMVQFSPENTKGDHTRTAAPGGYQYDATKIRGFALTHLSGTGCRGASGDIPLMPIAGAVETSPSSDAADNVYASTFSHANETASPGSYRVLLDSGVAVALTATERTGSARLTFPAGRPATVLFRVSDSEVGSSEARVTVDTAKGEVTGSVVSGNFCGYLVPIIRRSYYTLFFVAEFDRAFSATGAWVDGDVKPGELSASGGMPYDEKGYPAAGKGSGAWVSFDAPGATVNVRIGISYVSLANARANLAAENPKGTTFEAIEQRARAAWNRELSRIEIEGGTRAERVTFATALYHALLHPNLFSDVNGEYRGFDQEIHAVASGQKAQYANFSGWDVYRSQIPLVTLLRPDAARDIAQSLLNQANQNGGEWDRWTHNSGGTHVMAGDPSAPAIAEIVAFGGTGFDARGALASLVAAASRPTAHDLSNAGCPVSCVGQRPSLDRWLNIHYIPAASNSWGGAGETLEDATADFAVAELARRLGESETAHRFLARSGYWRNVFNAAATPEGGYAQNRNEDGSWPKLDPASDDGFAEGSAAQYTWMVRFDAAGLFEALGGRERANRRLDAFFRKPDGSWALTKSGDLHAEMSNEPSIAAPWLYDFAGRPYRTQETVREILRSLWSDAPGGIPGNDDLGEMSAWYVWSALGMYPMIPGRAELVLASPLFARAVIRRQNGPVLTIEATCGAPADAPYVRKLELDGKTVSGPWLPESFALRGGRLVYTLSSTPDPAWGSGPSASPPSFREEAR